jgi:hypothetical protein
MTKPCRFGLAPGGLFYYFLPMNLMKERSRGEIIMFATAIFGIWLSIWAVILTSVALDVVAVLFVLLPLLIFAFRALDE